jgi:hypothetical protein
VRPDELERQLSERLEALGPAPRAELLSVCSPSNASAIRPYTPFDHIKDPGFTQPPGEPKWRKVILVLAAIAIVVVLAVAVGAVVR